MSESSTQPAAILALYRDIALLRRGPEELPVSWSLLVVTMVAQIVLALLLSSLLPQLPPKAGIDNHWLALLVIESVVPLLWGWALLRFIGRPERFLQMMTAMFGCQLVFLPLAGPAAWAGQYLAKGSGLLMLAEMAQVVLSVWITVATARILRAATDWPMAACVVLVVTQDILTLLVSLMLFPDLAILLKQAS